MGVFLRKYNTAITAGTSQSIKIPMVKRGVVDFAVGADWTPASGDVKVSKDGGAAANIATLPAAVVMGNTAYWEFVFSNTELACGTLVVTIADSATKAVEDQEFIIETFGNASAMYQWDMTLANLPANVTQLLGTAWLTPAVAGTPDVNAKQIGGTGQTARDIGANVLLSVGTGTGQVNLSSGKVPATLAASDVTGNVAADLQTIKTQAVTAAAGVTFPSSIASPTNITAGTITTVTTVTNQLTAAAIATGIWQDTTAGDFTVASSIGKSLYTSGNVPGAANGISIVGSTMVAGTVNDKTGYSLTVTPPTAATIATTVWQDLLVGADFGTAGSIGALLKADVNAPIGSIPTNPYTGTPPTTAQIATAVWQDTTAGDFTVASSIGKSLYAGGNAPGAANGIAVVGSAMILSAAYDAAKTAATATAVASVQADTTSILARIGAFTGTGINTVLGFLKAMFSKTASTPSDMGGTATAANDSLEAVRNRGDAAWLTGSGGGLSGANAVTLTFTDSVTHAPLQLAKVKISLNSAFDLKQTDASGVVPFTADNGTWTIAATLSGYTFTPASLAVSGDVSQAYTMTPLSIDPGDAGSTTTGWWLACVDGVPTAGVEYQYVASGGDVLGVSPDAIQRTIVSGVGGLTQFTMLLGVRYAVSRGRSGKPTMVQAPMNSGTMTELTGALGSP